MLCDSGVFVALSVPFFVTEYLETQAVSELCKRRMTLIYCLPAFGGDTGAPHKHHTIFLSSRFPGSWLLHPLPHPSPDFSLSPGGCWVVPQLSSGGGGTGLTQPHLRGQRLACQVGLLFPFHLCLRLRQQEPSDLSKCPPGPCHVNAGRGRQRGALGESLLAYKSLVAGSGRLPDFPLQLGKLRPGSLQRGWALPGALCGVHCMARQ